MFGLLVTVYDWREIVVIKSASVWKQTPLVSFLVKVLI